MFSETEQKVINEKVEQLQKIKEGVLIPLELAEQITQRRVNWLEEHLDEMLLKYKGLSPEEQAYRIICFDHMKIDPETSEILKVSPTKLRIDSYNFCPYLEACSQLDLDTRVICKEVGEPSIQKMVEMINPKLKFSRNYDKIRPFSPYFCEEFIELV